MPAFRDTEEFKRGQSGERVVAGILMNRGWFVVPSYDYSGEDGNKAPKMQGADLSLVIPDLDIARGGDRRWIEVKTKLEEVLGVPKDMDKSFTREDYLKFVYVLCEEVIHKLKY